MSVKLLPLANVPLHCSINRGPLFSVMSYIGSQLHRTFFPVLISQILKFLKFSNKSKTSKRSEEERYPKLMNVP